MEADGRTALAGAYRDEHLRYVLGLDLGRKTTYAANSLMVQADEYVLKRQAYQLQCEVILEEHNYSLKGYDLCESFERKNRPRPTAIIKHHERVPLGTRYHDIARYTRTML